TKSWQSHATKICENNIAVTRQGIEQPEPSFFRLAFLALCGIAPPCEARRDTTYRSGSKTKIATQQRLVTRQMLHRAFVPNHTLFQHVDPVRDQTSKMQVLFG